MKKKKNTSLILIALLVLIAGSLAFFSYRTMTKAKEDLASRDAVISEKTAYITDNTRYLYVATGDIKKGDLIIENRNVEMQACLTALPEYMYIDETNLGMAAVVDIEEGSPIFRSLVCEENITKDMRQVEIAQARLMLNLMPNDYVDLRIRFANGADYIVASKLRVRYSDVEHMVFYTDLNENEIMTLASATIDAYTNAGTLIYLTKYEEPTLQEASVVTYPVSDTAYQLMLNDPNIYNNAITEINRANREYLSSELLSVNMNEKWLSAVVTGEGLADTASNSILMNSGKMEMPEEDYTVTVTEEEQ